MFKKVVSVLLAIVFMLGLCVIPSVAADNSADCYDKTDLERLFTEFFNLPRTGTIRFSDGFVEEIDEATADGATLADALSDYAIAEYDAVSDIDEIADRIAKSATYIYTTTWYGKNTVYIAINLEENPELWDSEIFRAAVIKMVDGQYDSVPENAENLDLLDYKRFAGELWMHMQMFDWANEHIKGLLFIFALILRHMAVDAEMNIDEIRLPSFIFSIKGSNLI